MRTLRIPSEQRKSAWAYLIMIVLVMICFHILRSPENVLDVYISRESFDETTNVAIYKPKLSLPRGSYEFQLTGSGGSGSASVQSADGTFYGMSQVGDSGAVVAVNLDQDVSNLLIRTQSNDANSVPSFSRVRVISDGPIFTDGILLAFMVLLALLGIGYVKYLHPEGDRTEAFLFVLITGAAVVASYPLFTSYVQYGHDINFHLWRIEGIKDGLLSGQFPVRVHPTHNNGYGYITASVYGELFLYLPAVLRLMGVSSVMAYKTFLFVMNLATAWIMYHSVKQMSGSREAAGLASVIYTLSTWRLINAYHRAAIGEASAMTFFPLVALGIYYIFKGDKSKWYVLAIGCTGVFQTHVISTVLIAMLLVILFVIYIRPLFWERRFWPLCKAGILTVLLNLWYLVPFAYYYFTLDMAIHHTPFNTQFFDNAVIPAELFNVFNTAFGMSNLLPSGVQGEMSLSLGVGVSLCLIVGLLYYMFRRKKEPRDIDFVLFASGVALTWMSTSLFPWQLLQQNALINKFAGTVRMPWRFLSLASPFLCMTGTVVMLKWAGKRWQQAVIASVCVLCAVTLVNFGAAFTTSIGTHVKKGMAIPEGASAGWDNEYYLITTNRNELKANVYRTSDDSVQVTQYKKRGSNIDVGVSGAKDGSYVEVPLLYYPGYAAKDDQNRELAVVSGNNDVARVMLRDGSSAIRVWYRGMLSFKIATGISAVTLIALLAHLWRRRKRRGEGNIADFFRRETIEEREATPFRETRIGQGLTQALRALKPLQKYVRPFLVCMALALFMEVFVFNYQSIESLRFEEQDVLDRLTISGALQRNEDGSWSNTGGEVLLELADYHQSIDNLHLKVDTGSTRAITLWISATDTANSQPLGVPARTLWANEPRTEYLRLHFSGDVETLRIRFNVNENESVRLLKCAVNAKRPLFFSFGRFLLVGIFAMVLYLLRPKSSLHAHPLNLKRPWQRAILLVLVLVQVLAFWQLVHINPAFMRPGWEHHTQYHRLTEAFLNGHTYLDKEPPQALIDMENPYDYAERSKVMAETGSGFLWDHAYYNGKYYVYFGVMPVLVFYLPYYVITGTHLPTYMAIFITSLALIFGVLYLLYQIIRRWFRDVPFTVYLILAALFINSCGIIYILKRPDFYSLPLLMGVVFGVMGVGLWISALGGSRKDPSRLSAWRIALGSLSIALIAGCRPQLLLVMGLGVILFWRAVFHDRTLFSKSSIKQTLALCVPFVVVAAGVMAYNYVRFDSIFDFGSNYNLTFNDMRQRGFVWARSFLGIYSQLFQPASIAATFPFIKMISVQTSYLGGTITEGMFGGVIFNNPFLWLSVFIFLFRKQIVAKQARYVAMAASIFAVVLVVLDTQMAGILMRYQSDFTWLLLLSASIGALALYGFWENQQAKRFILWGLMGCLVVCFSYHGIEIVVDISDTVQANNPQVYYHLQSLIAFWL